MDIYRARFVQYPTPGINALAFSHTSKSDFPSPKADTGGRHSLRLAVGRTNGDIEIWNPLEGRWLQEAVFKGGKGRSIEGLVWTQEPSEAGEDGKSIPGALRLFSIGYSNAVTEWNLTTGLPLREWSETHSEIWCLAAQPRLHLDDKITKPISSGVQWIGQNLVAGCADGSLIVLSTADNDLQFQKFLARSTTKSARVLSLAFQNRSTLIAGFADSTVKLYDLRKGQLIRSITLGAGPKGGPKNILVWSVKAMANGDIVTGDSTGEVRFFDRKQLSQIHRIASHDADILDLVVSQSKGAVFSAGMDRRTVRYLKGSTDSARWAKTDHTTMHEHDVKALAAHESDKLDIIASGGLDTNLVISPLRQHGDQYQYTLSGLPQHPPICHSSRARLIVTWWEREVSIWSIAPGRKAAQKKHSLKARIAVQGDENITCAAISSDGRRLVVASSSDVKQFMLQQSLDKPGLCTVKKIGTIPTKGARLVRLSQDGEWLAVTTATNDMVVLQSHAADEPFSGQQTLKRAQQSHKHDATLGNYLSTSIRIEFSPDSKMLVASDLKGYIDSWILLRPEDTAMANGVSNTSDTPSSSEESENEDSHHRRWKHNKIHQLRLDSPAIVLSFRLDGEPTTQHNLLVVTAKHRIRELDMKTGLFTEWSKQNPNSVMPEAFKRLKDRAMGAFNGANGWLWLYGSTWLFGLDVTVDHREPEQQTTSSHDDVPNRKKRKLDNTGAGDAVKKADKIGLVIRRESQSQINGLHDEEHGSDVSDSEDEVFAEGLRGGHETHEDGKKGKAKWYLTHKYRPILGIVPVREASNGKLPEVVLVERPIWTLDLPGRYDNEYS